MGVHARHLRVEPFREEERRSYLLLANGQQDLRGLPGHRIVERVDREDHKHLPEVRLTQQRRQGGDHLQQPSHQYGQLYDRNRLDPQGTTTNI